MDDRFQVSTRAITGTATGRVLVLPGRAYTVDHPVLYWVCQVLAGAGWQITEARWQIDEDAWADPGGFVADVADAMDAAAPPAPATLVVAKSFGTYGAGWAAGRNLPGIWLTPVLDQPVVADALAASQAPALLVGGSADTFWDSGIAVATGKHVLTLPEADHALHVGTDWHASLSALGETLSATERFASSLTPGSPR